MANNEPFNRVSSERARHEVLRLVAAGMNTAEIPDAAGIGRSTVSHLKHGNGGAMIALEIVTRLRAIPTPVRPIEDDPEAWKAHGACNGVDVNVFYPEVERNPDGDRSPMWSRPKAICETCDVRQACLDHALTAPERHGMWGGMTPNQRRLLLRRRRERRTA